MSFEYDIPCVATTRSDAEVPISLKIAKSFRDKAIGYMGAKSIGKSTGMVYARAGLSIPCSCASRSMSAGLAVSTPQISPGR